MNKKNNKTKYFNYNIRKVDINKYDYNKSYYNQRFIIVVLILIVFICILIISLNKEKNKKTEEENYNHIVCIDPGHGGNDNGANNKNRFEKDDNLKLALSIKEELEKDKIKVILTRKDDTYVSLEDRTNIANDSKSELFISIHRNSSDINTAKGIEIWIMDNREDALSLANNIIGELQIIDKDNIRGIKSGTEKGNNINYYVNKYTNMPSCIIELGFISNKEDNNSFDKKMNLYVKHIAMGIFKELN